MRVAVIGTGGIGGYFGGRLAAAGHEVVLVARGDHLAAIRRDGLRVHSVAGDVHVAPAEATDDPAHIGTVDLVLVAVKTWQLAGVLPLLPGLLRADTAVLTTQNGVEAPAVVAEVVGQGAVLPGVAKIFAMVTAPGTVSHVGGPASLTFGEWDDRRSPRVTAICEAFTAADVDVSASTAVWTDLWAKMLLVVPLGGLGAALDAPVGELRTSHRSLLAEAMAEVAALARARGVTLPDTAVERALGFVDQQPADATSSLQRDVLAGRASELDAWTGAVVRLAAESGVGVPVHRTLLAVISARHPHALPARA
jgi:2-dehydropantoate 2-reductase